MDSTFFCLILLVCVVLALFAVISQRHHQRAEAYKRLRAAYTAYHTALTKLKLNPSNATIKQEALYLGRAYAAMTREQQSVTIYDEMALMNDINAATAGASSIGVAPPVVPIEARLLVLADLQKQGLITADEYAARRQKLINEV